MVQNGQIDSLIGEAARRLRQEFGPCDVFLYGSHAYGTPGPGSDMDLLVVVEKSLDDPYTRDAKAYRVLTGLRVAKDVQVYTRDEFEERAALPVSFERTVKTRGKLLRVA